ncbi:Zinc carboxypeptidase [Bernardetia litoralis DSM 6794]|uniref:Zinc carboxypeptidase n=1 Tax=Bernardetia litoralis (strain ATCC 23117 / DSM 6794 / NBRC 15988 / NCIMB 1366 / Fx l1 / Sio-4) TaxID=880071 RepID=I4AQN7_BERLS|nr:M14 family zinc carboxypeptidase [Bernardetia litoralis]AFM06272.1 Zinc carboxypeptidase [Bernardetia litoralis DSM 6794]
MKLKLSLILPFVFLLFINPIFAQKTNSTSSKIQDYYFQTLQKQYAKDGKELTFNPEISTPKQVLGFEVGDWHVSHDKLLFYLHTLAQQSNRISIDTIGFTHEQRPLIQLIITNPTNQNNLEEIRKKHVELTNPSSATISTENLPVVVWQGYSIHGNEASGSNAALLYAYYLAAAEGEEIENKLKNAVIILDPSFNPDGLNRFASWVNMHKSKSQVTDPNRRETNEPFPMGRTNHYWFDLNRDWLPVQQPESKARLKRFHEWKPNILTDHHEMGTNSTFFFQPGVPQRTNPITPQKNQELTAKIGTFHAKFLDNIGSLYYTEQSFDDFYYGKGSTYPDANGSVGILFEQASARGHAQDSQNGVITFEFAIRNQLTTSLSTLEAAVNIKKELLDYQQNFYKTVNDFAKNSTEKGYLIGGKNDIPRFEELLKILETHQIEFYVTNKEVKETEKKVTYTSKNSVIVPINQTQGRLVKAIFETSKSFKDSIFYDVSAWNFSYAFGLEQKKLAQSEVSNLKGNKINASYFSELFQKEQNQKLEKSEIGYLIDWKNYYAPKLVNQLLENNLNVKVSQDVFSYLSKNNEKENGKNKKVDFDRGTIFVKSPENETELNNLMEILTQASQEYSIKITSLKTGLTDNGIDLGSPSFQTLKLPKVLVVVGEGVDSYETGEIWHLLDTRYGMKISLIEARELSKIDLHDYTTIVLPSGYPQNLNPNTLSSWTENGGTLIAIGSSINFLKGSSYFNLDTKSNSTKSENNERLMYQNRDNNRGSNYIGGLILEGKLDLSNPIAFGYESETIRIFKDNSIFLEYSDNPYNMPLIYSSNPKNVIVSGYLSNSNKEKLKNSISIISKNVGQGKFVAFADNPNFRAFWYGTNRLFINSIFFN